MPLRVSYWTGWLDPLMVAVSKEVFQLMSHFRRSHAFGISPRYGFKYSRVNRSLGVHPALYPLFRRAMPHLEKRFDVSHVYTNLGDWHFLNALGERPIVLTVTDRSKGSNPQLLRKVAHVAAESENLAGAAVQAGVPQEKVSVVYPGVDLNLFRETPPPARPWKGLFASSPENSEEIHTKGVDLLLELAAQEPELQLTLLWRPFGPASEVALRKVCQRNLPNVQVVRGRISDIQRFFGQFHFTFAPFRTVGKPCPNSILESLASGRPVLVSTMVDIAKLIVREGAGLAFDQTAEGICAAYQELCASYGSFQREARTCAEKHFNLKGTVAAYEAIYQKVRSSH